MAKSRKNNLKTVWLDEDGSQAGCMDLWAWRASHGPNEPFPRAKEVPNFVWDDTLVYVRYLGGRSAMSMLVTSLTTGRHYSMMWTDFEEQLRRPDLRPGPTFSGKWTFIKRGVAYGVTPAFCVDKTAEEG